ncbi:hypothetical protein AB0E82_32310 [Streptomyces anulatus]|uniref:hypothetical protein n=1 Tax=Streptomyces anulatus TaxID=1892 RepID=UPI0033FC939A
MPERVTHEAAEHLVQEVTARYAQLIITHRRTGAADDSRMQDLKEKLAACAADRRALHDADENTVAEIAARYAARLKELDGE